MTEVDLNFISRQVGRVLSEQADTRDQLMMINARLMSIEVSIDSLARRIERMNERVRNVEASR